MLRVRAEAPLRPTESAEKLSAAIRSLFPDALLEVHADRVVGTTESLVAESTREPKARP